MNPSYRAIYTCTPKPFLANPFFFMRDTGLISRVLRGMGLESKTVMPLPWYDGDQRDHVLRVEPRRLNSPDYWRSLNLDGVVLYSWGAPRYLCLARAIHAAGIRLVIHLDFNGAFDPSPRFPRALRNLAVNLLRAKHLSYADVISASPLAKEYLLRHRLYGPSLTAKVQDMPTPVSPHFFWDGTPKERRVVCVGRWDGAVKRPEFMMEAVRLLLQRDADVHVDICGPISDTGKDWHDRLPPSHRERVHISGFIPNEKLPQIYRPAQISLCTSASEGTHIASAEALCCGCTVCTPNRPEKLRMVHWYTSKNSGRIAREDTPESLTEAILEELDAWQRGERNPANIAETWQPLFHADKALARIFDSLA